MSRVCRCEDVAQIGDTVGDAPLALHAAHTLIRSRSLGRAAFADGLFHDPAFDILLALFVAREEGKRVLASAVATSGKTPEKVGLRWISRLEALGMIRRWGITSAGREQTISLTEEARARVIAWLAPPPLGSNSPEHQVP